MYESAWKQLLEKAKAEKVEDRILFIRCSIDLPLDRLVKALYMEKDRDLENKKIWKLHKLVDRKRRIVKVWLARKSHLIGV